TPAATSPAPAADGPAATSVAFTEQMAGPFTLGTADPRAAAALARPLGHRLMFELTISTGPLAAFLADPERNGDAVGYVQSDVMGGRMPVERGWFNLFVHRPDQAGRRMLYRLWFHDPGGSPFTLTGFKVIRDDPGFDLWSDTTTLYTQVLAGHVGPGEPEDPESVRGAGVIRITPRAFARQLTTFTADGPHAARALACFGRLFAGELWAVYGAPLLRLRRPR
ncbi:MAG: FAD-dependent oxidoreductase, partial [Friedmanniella sp.]|nr:FAD-dependent oxidoreductase [Friedmanniella sp.]